ncbi:MAG: MBL fold metallo-hydrolase [Candidatus Thorarchaeota archaeon]|nr:MBL fold metallo-hydrolase [Candidatus Thorarchaeota archaeon]
MVLLFMTAIIDGVVRIEIPTPFPVGSVNCYLIEGTPLTLIDTGPRTSRSLATITQEMRNIQYDLSDIEQILLTHNHIDHIGLTAEFVRERKRVHDDSSMVWIHQSDADALVDYDRYMELYAKSITQLIAACGIPTDEVPIVMLEDYIEHFKSFGEPVLTAQGFEDGTSFKTGIGELTALWVPGHSPGSTCFVCDEKQVVFSGDHILGDISSNPSISFDSSERIGMITYLESLSRISSKENYIALPGHREPIFDIESRVETLRAEYDSKLQKAADALTSTPQTIYRISRAVYGEYDANSLALALAESRDLLSILESRNQAELINQNGLVYAVKH